ncbi:MAG: hypothetical protein KDD29_08400, partial [Flavobacteriales bacterium]|nr:hypothetical protein [Flavobacteriales bacterium]
MIKVCWIPAYAGKNSKIIETKFVDIILPLSIPYLYTYRVPKEIDHEIMVGQRVVVQFGRG